jgi:ribonuclease HI
VKEVIVYTDGACSGNPGPGGWAALLRYGGHQKVVSGGEPMSTNNRMELTAALEALRALTQPCRVRLHTDSAYLHNAFTRGWLDKWRRNGWRTSSKKPVENQDLWEALVDVGSRHEVTWVKVRGHANDELNNLVDELAVAAMEKYKV